MSVSVAAIIGLVLALAGTIAACILITPEKKRSTLNKFLKVLHDIFNFKDLLLEKILKVLYIFTSLFCVFGGFFMLFSGVKYYNYWTGGYDFQSMALYGFLLMVLGPIVLRIIFESSMLFIICVKNVITIAKNTSPAEEKTTKVEAPKASKMVFCTVCGTKYDANEGSCPNGCKPE